MNVMNSMILGSFEYDSNTYDTWVSKHFHSEPRSWSSGVYDLRTKYKERSGSIEASQFITDKASARIWKSTSCAATNTT